VFLGGVEITSSSSSILLRKNSANYISTVTGGKFCFIANGKTLEEANSDLIIDNNLIYPGTTSLVNLGSSNNKWKNVYADTFTGALSGNASSANKLNTNAGSVSVPVYFSGGIPVQCTPSNIFSSFTCSTDSSKGTIKTTICGQERTVDIGAATTTLAGLLTATDQTIAGNKTFNNDTTLKGKTKFENIIVLDADSYGPELPSSGVEGQVFFLLID
jgi:hypothetical protein